MVEQRTDHPADIPVKGSGPSQTGQAGGAGGGGSSGGKAVLPWSTLQAGPHTVSLQ